MINTEQLDEFEERIPGMNEHPLIHVITYRENLPVNQIAQFMKIPKHSTLVQEHSQYLKEGKDKAVAILNLILGSDIEASEYLLLSLLSRVHTRKTGLVIGNVPLNISNVMPEQAALLQQFLSEVCAFLCPFKSSLEALTKTKFICKKNY
jgi:hypothetical protein